MDRVQANNIAIAREFLSRLGAGTEPDAIVELFAEDMTWDVRGHSSAFPWVGGQSGRQAVRAFLAEAASWIRSGPEGGPGTPTPMRPSATSPEARPIFILP
jgi:ketosteroid isomerase-like protein